LGVAYKRDVDDPRESPAFALLELLGAAGAILSYHDPHVPKLPAMRRYQLPPLESTALTEEFLAGQDCVLIVTDHAAVDYDYVVRHAPLVVDTRNATRSVREGREKIRKA
jgi:UDP-N-acetyl-D-glucosamine dehydrogenase